MSELRFRLSDPQRELVAVRLVSDGTKRRPPAFRRRGSRWELRIPSPPLARLEYLLEVERLDGSRELLPDPANPQRAPGPFGDKSVLELDGYRAPVWLGDDEAPTGRLQELSLANRALRATVSGLVWSAAGTDPTEPLPLLVAHDGPEYAEFSGLLRYLDSAVADLAFPPLRAALLQPVSRNEHYSASARYSTAFERDIAPGLRDLVPTSALVGMGASLGALALLHVHRLHPETFAGLYLQSGSFFRRRFDKHEADFERFARITRFVGRVLNAGEWEHPIPVTITCGTGEENLRNNRALAEALAAQGYSVELVEHGDTHNWVSWRDVFDPHLADLVVRSLA
jgi:enterochelin esterase-like enzyme